jgi:molybdopterin synthase catalytic subunit
MGVLISPQPIEVDAQLAGFAAQRANAGAMASFVGYCRTNAQGRAVERLELQHYPGFTESEIARMAVELKERRKLIDLLVIHRVGIIAPEEAIVLVAALSEHRGEAFAAVEELMDYLKTDAPIWKLEVTEDGARWVEPTEADRERTKRVRQKS